MVSRIATVQTVLTWDFSGIHYLSHCYRPSMCVCVSVCASVCVHALTVAILNRFWWNLAQTSGTWYERTLSVGSKSNNGIPYFYPILPHPGSSSLQTTFVVLPRQTFKELQVELRPIHHGCRALTFALARLSCQPLFQIRCKYVQWWPSYGQNVIFNMAAAEPPLSWILSDTSSEGKRCPGTLVSVSASNLVQIRSKMAELWVIAISKRPPPPSWIYFRCLFLSFSRLWIVAGNVPVKFRMCTYIVCVREYTADLLSFVRKTKWRPPPSWAAILNCYFVTLDHRQSLLHARTLRQSHYYCPRYGHLKVLYIWLR